ncbi:MULTISPECIES: HAD family hydrolase [unclassified Rhizobium]|uniref:HAD family hydrolase n=1 Tax=unclassified Rhizobium TaxID=2613769 RepID=UPI0006F7819E|nr:MULTISPECIES: HAD family hydrolase [unclassified Rhizobium]KQV36447.1 hypothetical protein ASC86_24735 [Rhizobium sp. Root1212]KRD26737.1 hypothetical protein ASE37_24650 [Rhizobium sp. Root268]
MMVDLVRAKRLIEGADVVSFDIFDTLIRRKVDSPRDVFNLMKGAAHAISRGQVSDFRAARVLAEQNALSKAQETGIEEITFSQIYDELQTLTGIADVVKEAIQALEVETELRCVDVRVVGRDLLEFASRQRKKIVLVSDMYLPRDVILSLLERAGVRGFSTLYLSNELLKTKRLGDLFTHILNELSLKPSQVVHIGDNPRGDVSTPNTLGIETIHIPRSMVNFREASPFGKSIALAGRKHSSLTKSAVDALIADRFFDTRDKLTEEAFFRSDPFQFGYSALGPLLLGMSFWLYREAKADGIERLYFLSRDGAVMKSVFDALFPSDEYGIETDYLYCSRRVVRVPLMQNKFDLLQPVSKPIHKRTLGSWLEANYGVDPNQIDQALFHGRGFEGPDHFIDKDVDREALSSLVSDLHPILIEVATSERRTLEQYLAHKGVGEGRHAVVDIGYAGTMQEALSNILHKELKGYYLAVFGTSANVKNQLGLKGFLSQYGADDNPALGICTHRFVYESLVCSSEDSVLRIGRTDAGFKPVGLPSENDRERKSFVDYAHSGALSLAREYRATSPIPPEESVLSPEASSLIFDAYLRQPMAKDVALLYGVGFEDIYGLAHQRYLAVEPGLVNTVLPSQVIWKESLSVKAPVKTMTAKDAELAGKKALNTKDYPLAAANFRKAYDLLPSRPNYLRMVAEAHYSGGDKKSAINALNEFIKINPRNLRAKARKLVMTFPPLSKIIGSYEFNIR